jgi:hypothetical protein
MLGFGDNSVRGDAHGRHILDGDGGLDYVSGGNSNDMLRGWFARRPVKLSYDSKNNAGKSCLPSGK